MSPLETITKNEGRRKINSAQETAYKEDRKRYEEELKHYNDVVLPAYEKRLLDEENRYQSEIERVSAFNKGLQDSIDYLEEEKRHTADALKKMYETYVINPKYRGIIPITMFCEYIDSGKGTVLEGDHGIYNLFESELLGNQIVARMEKINTDLQGINYQDGGVANQLTGIQRNQTLLYEEISRGNNIARQISDDTSTILEKVSATASLLKDTLESMGEKQSATHTSSAMRNYYAKMVAHRTDSGARIGEYEFSLRQSGVSTRESVCQTETVEMKRERIRKEYLDSIRLLEVSRYIFSRIMQHLKSLEKKDVPFIYHEDPTKVDYKIWYIKRHLKFDHESLIVPDGDAGHWEDRYRLYDVNKGYLNFEWHETIDACCKEAIPYYFGSSKLDLDAQQEYENDCRFWKTGRLVDIAKIKMYNAGIDRLIKTTDYYIRDNTRALEDIYSIDFIYPKYRDIIPITMFCDYLNSEKCSALDGYRGLYSLYDYELSSQYITNDLIDICNILESTVNSSEEIASQLQGTAKNQILLYEELALGNRMADNAYEDALSLLDSLSSNTTREDDISPSLSYLDDSFRKKVRKILTYSQNYKTEEKKSEFRDTLQSSGT